MNTYIPEGYKSLLSIYDTQKAISLLKRIFADNLGAKLDLYRVSAPLFVVQDSGLNDNLNGYERPVSFDILHAEAKAEVVQSLAKWKRLALKRYGFWPGKGIYTDMDAIRRDEDELDNLHSVYVDQWDWEKVILPENRNLDYLKSTVMDIVAAICDTQSTMQAIYPQLSCLPKLEKRVSFVTTQQLTTAAPRTMTTGISTAISCSGTMYSAARWRFPPWASASIPRPWIASSPLPAATTEGSCPTTRPCSQGSFP